MMQSLRNIVLKLYKNLLRESNCLDSYNFRMYALRRIKDSFKENKGLTDELQIKNFIQEGEKNLAIIRRQAVISNLYSIDKLVIENLNK